jgi:hypothetical protein
MMPMMDLERAYAEVLGRLSRYEKMNGQLALSVVSDRHFMASIASESDPQRIEEKIDARFVDIADRLQKEKDTLSKSVRDQASEIKVRDTKIETLMAKMHSFEERLEKSEHAARTHRERAEKMETDLRSQSKLRENAEGDALDIRGEFKRFKISLLRWLTSGAAFIFVSLGFWLLITRLIGELPLLKQIVLGVSSQLLLLFLFFTIPFREYWKFWVGGALTLTIAILTLLFAL